MEADTNRAQENGEKQFDRETAREVLKIVPDRPLASLYDVALLYAAASQYENLTATNFPDNASVETAMAMTPESSNFFGQDDSVVVARVDLSGPKPQLGDPPVIYRTYTEKNKYAIGYMARQSKTARSTDYSLTNSTSTSSSEEISKIAHDEWADRFMTGRFTRFPFRDSVEKLVENQVEGYELLETLQQLGENQDFIDRIQQAVLDETTIEQTQALLTVQFKRPGDDEYKYPGEIPVLNRAGVEERRQHLIDGISIESSGQGVGYVSNETGEVLGATPGINRQYSKLKVTRFQNLNPELGWTNRPVSVEIADAIGAGDEVLDKFYIGRNGLRLYYLPYPTTKGINLDVFRRFVEDVYRPLSNAIERGEDNDGTSEYYVTRLLQILVETGSIERQSADSLRPDDSSSDEELDAFLEEAQEKATTEIAVDETGGPPMALYASLHNAGSDPSRTFAEDSNAPVGIVTNLNQIYVGMRRWLEQHPVFGSAPTGTYVFPPTEGAYSIARQILNGFLFDDLTSLSSDPDSGRPGQRRGTLESPELNEDWNLIAGRPLSQRELLRAYSRKLQKAEREQRENPDAFGPVPYVIAQYEQLRVLEKAGHVDTPVLNTKEITMTESEYESQAERLEAFIDEHALLQENNAERAAFALGGLVARVGALQGSSQLDRSRTATQQYPVDRLGKTTFEEVAEGILDKNQEYADVLEKTSQRLNFHYIEILEESLLDTPPTEWSVGDSRLRWVYALGMAYGKNDYSSDFFDESGEGVEQ